MVRLSEHWRIHASYLIVIAVLAGWLISDVDENDDPQDHGDHKPASSARSSAALRSTAGRPPAGTREDPAGSAGIEDIGKKISIPQTLLPAVKLPPLLTASGNDLNPDLVKLMDWDEETVQALNGAVQLAAEEIKALETRHLELVDKPNGDQFYLIKAFPEKGQAIREQLRQQVRDLTDEGGAAMVDRAGLRDLGGFGNSDRELIVVWPREGEEDKVFVQSRPANLYARHRQASGRKYSVEEAWGRFGHLFEVEGQKK